MTTTYEFEERCHRAIQELRQTEQIDLTYANIAPTAPGCDDVDLVLRNLAEEEDVHLDDTFRRYFFSPLEIHAQWRSTGHPRIVGEFCLHHIQEGITDPEHVPEDTTLDMPEQEVMVDLRAIDSAPRSGTGRVAALRITDGSPSEVWFYDMSHHRLEQLDIDYASYMECTLATKGTAGWQYLFSDVDFTSPEMEDIRARLEAMLSTFPQVFPDYDYTLLRARLEARL